MEAQNVDLINQENSYFVGFSSSGMYYSASASSTPRNYYGAVTAEQRADIKFIVKTLGNSSLPSIAKQKSSLEKAGARINSVHPLKFLLTVFTDEELKVGMRNLKNRGGWVWSDFSSGLKDSLAEEASRANMKPEFIEEFAVSVGVSSAILTPSIQGSRWGEFVEVLINNVPRNGDPNRYDM